MSESCSKEVLQALRCFPEALIGDGWRFCEYRGFIVAVHKDHQPRIYHHALGWGRLEVKSCQLATA